MRLEWLSDDQAQQFRQSGYLTVKKCFGPDDARPWIDTTWRRLGYRGDAAESWRPRRFGRATAGIVLTQSIEDLDARQHRPGGLAEQVPRLPSHTYDRTSLPCDGGWTVVDRMRRNLPVVVHGDGTSLWTLTHHTDFAKGFVPLLGNPRVIGDSFHITSEEALSWDESDDRRRRGSAGADRARRVGRDRGS